MEATIAALSECVTILFDSQQDSAHVYNDCS
jgi:hypothetical protein